VARECALDYDRHVTLTAASGRPRRNQSLLTTGTVALVTTVGVACGKTDNSAPPHPPSADADARPEACLAAASRGLSPIVDRTQLDLAVDETFGDLSLSTCRLHFNTVATRSQSLGPPPVRSLWVTEGSVQTTKKLGAGAEVLPLQAGAAVFYGVRSEGRLELWAAGDLGAPLKLHPYGGAERAAFKDALVFTGAESYPSVLGAEVWSSRGDPQTTTLLHDVNREAGAGSEPKAYTVVGERLYFIASVAVGTAPLLWQSDGSVAAKVPGDLTPRGSAESGTSPLFATATWLIFGGSEPSRTPAVYCVGDAERGVRKLEAQSSSGVASPASGVTRYAAVDGTVFAFAQTQAEPRPDLGRECPPNARDGLWRIDCERQTLALVADTPSAPGCDEFRDVASTRSHACVVDGERRLRCSDGTVAGTRELATGTRGAVGLGAYVLWSDDNSVLWSADPSTNAAPTRLAQRVPDSSMALAGAWIYFVGTDPAQGAEPWVTDGSLAGTRSIADLEPGSNGSAPRGFVGDTASVFFVAQRGGVEAIWRYR
jgi:ELWxxDGT repeat protein